MFNSGANLLTMTWQIKAWARERGLAEWVDRNQTALDRMLRYALAFYGPASETQKKHRDQLNAMIKTGKQPLGIMLALYENLPANDSLYDHDLSYFTPGDWKDAFEKRKLPFSVGEVKLDAEAEGVLWRIATAIHRKDTSNFKPGVTVELLAEAFRVLSPFDPFWTKGMNGAKPYLLTASEWAKAANVQLPPIKGHKVSHTDAREEWAKEVTRRLNEKAEASYSIKKGKDGEILFTVQHYRTAFSGGKEQVNKLPTFVRVQWPDGADMPVGMREFIGLPNQRHDTPAYMASKILAGLKREGFELEPPDDPSCQERGQGVCEVPTRTNRVRKNPDSGPASTCSDEYVFDSEGRKYPVVYRVVSAALDGSTVVTSHNPQTFGWQTDPPLNYPPSFQTRDLGNTAESTKINQIAANLEPIRLLGKNLDPTLGPPVVWPHAGRYYVLGGNGRTMAFLRASDANYRAYLSMARCRWSCFPERDPDPKHRWLLVREVQGLTEAQATQLAAASQKSTAATENKIAEAIGLVRSLDLNPADMPLFKFNGPLTPENVEELRRPNFTASGLREESPGGAFFQYIVQRLNKAAQSKVQQDPSEAARYLEAAVIGLLPVEAQRPALYEDSKSQDALLGAAPAVVSTHSWVLHDRLLPEYDLWTALQDAVPLFQTIRTRSPLQIRKAMDAEREQAKVAGAKRISDAPPLAWALALALRAAAGTAQPEARVADLIRPYYEAIQTECYRPAEKPTMSFMFGGMKASDPCEGRRKPAGDLFAESLKDAGISGSDTFYKNYYQIVHGEVPSGSSRALFNNPALIDNRGLPSVGTLLTTGKFTSGIADSIAPPRMRWMDPVTPETAKRFQNDNATFYRWAVKHLSPDASWQQAADALLAAMLVSLPSALVDRAYYLPAAQQRNLVAALPILVTLHQAATAGEIAPSYDPGETLPDALKDTRTPQEAREAMLRYAERAFASDPRQSRLFGNGKRRRRQR